MDDEVDDGLASENSPFGLIDWRHLPITTELRVVTLHQVAPLMVIRWGGEVYAMSHAQEWELSGARNSRRDLELNGAFRLVNTVAMKHEIHTSSQGDS